MCKEQSMNLRAYHEFHTIKRKESNITFFLLASLGGKPFLKHKKRGVPVGAQQKGTQLGSMWTQIPSLASLSGWGSCVAVAMAYRPATRAPIQPLTWELPYATHVARKRQKMQKGKYHSSQDSSSLEATNIGEDR